MKELSNNLLEFVVIPTYELFYNQDTSYGVYRFYSTEEIPYAKKTNVNMNIFNDKDEFGYESCLIGKCQQLSIMIPYTVQARPEYNDKRKQWQYVVKNIIIIKPKTIEEQQQFLQAIVTEKQARSILEVYPNIVQQILDNEEIDIEPIKGIGQSKFDKIKEKVVNNYGFGDILVLLKPLGVTENMIKKLLKEESNMVLLREKLLKNPYCLTELNGLGFKRVDGLALKLNPDLEVSDYRTVACINYVLEKFADEVGHTWVFKKTLIKHIKEMIPNCKDNFKNIIESEKEKKEFILIQEYNGEEIVGLKKYFNLEKSVLNKVMKIYNSGNRYNEVNLLSSIEKTNKQNGFNLTEEQISVIKKTVDNNVVLVTGKGGTGKTSVVKAILNTFSHYRIGMCALSARAARRMVEVTGFREAKTIHRLLEFNKIGFQRNEENPLSEDIIIIDEASMINAFLFNSLLKAVKPYAKIIIVFDHGQLPPIGVGNVATDLLSSTVLPVIRLNTVHRQAQKSGILMDANNIRENKSPFANLQVNMTTGELKDMHYMFRNDQEQLNSIALSLFYKLLDNGYSLDDIAIIVPRKAKCINSCFAINKEIQSKLLKNEVRFILKEEEKIYLGAKLIQRKNDYEKNVVNGEIGYLTNIKEDGSFEITFDSDKIVGYKKFETADLDLAYAITIHSSQGGQYKKVIVVLDQSHYILLDACLLYTAMTRAIEECWVISEVESFTKCVTENKNEKRQTYLCQLIKEYEELNEKLNKLNTID